VEWLNVESAFYSGAETGRSLERFCEAAASYTGSALFRQYEGSSLLPLGEEEELAGFVTAFSKAVSKGNRSGAEEAASEIRRLLVSWQDFEYRISDTLFKRFYQFFAFSILMFVLFLFVVWRLYRSLRLSQIREQDSSFFSQAVMLAQEQERSRISADLHDTVLQDMGRLIQRTANQGESALVDTERDIAARIREVCSAIMPPNFSRLSLSDSLVQLSIDFEKRTGIECRAGVQELVLKGLDPQMQLQCYRVVQEALNNIEKHTHSGEAVISARNARRRFPGKAGQQDSILVCVSDDGGGFAPGLGAEKKGLGIRGMYERAALMGADLSFINEIGQGLTVRLEIPLGEKNEQSCYYR
jgi:signal transduction histidine kinase